MWCEHGKAYILISFSFKDFHLMVIMERWESSLCNALLLLKNQESKTATATDKLILRYRSWATLVFSTVPVAQSSVFCVVIILWPFCHFSLSHCIVCPSSLSHCIVCPSSLSHCIVCPSSIFGYWLPLWYLHICLASKLLLITT